MNWIFTYQYELMYSCGALFALFSMMSYVVPAVNSAIENRENNKMDSSENFFEGFEGLNLEAIISDEDEVYARKEASEIPNKQSLKLVTESTEELVNVDANKDLKNNIDTPLGIQIDEPRKVKPLEPDDEFSESEKEKILKMRQKLEEKIFNGSSETKSKLEKIKHSNDSEKTVSKSNSIDEKEEAVANKKSQSNDSESIEAKVINDEVLSDTVEEKINPSKNESTPERKPEADIEKKIEEKKAVVSSAIVYEQDEPEGDEDDDDDIDYFSQSDFDVIDSDFAENEDDEKKIASNAPQQSVYVGEPVVDGFAKKTSLADKKKYETFLNPEQKEPLKVERLENQKNEVLKVSTKSSEKGLLIMKKNKRLSSKGEEVLSLKKNKEDF